MEPFEIIDSQPDLRREMRLRERERVFDDFFKKKLLKTFVSQLVGLLLVEEVVPLLVVFSLVDNVA